MGSDRASTFWRQPNRVLGTILLRGWLIDCGSLCGSPSIVRAAARIQPNKNPAIAGFLFFLVKLCLTGFFSTFNSC